MSKRKPIQRKTTATFVCLISAILFSVILITPSAAQDYPNRPISVYCGFGAGGSWGLIAETLTENMSKYLPQPMVVQYKPGASSAIAADYVLSQPADGYTLYWYSVTMSLKLAFDGPKLNFTKDDFIAIGTVAEAALGFPVRKDSPFKTLEEFIDYAKKHPGELSYGSAGVAGATHLTSMLLEEKAGIKMKHVPMTGGSKAIPAVLGGHIDTYFNTPTGSTGELIKAGDLRLLAVFSEERVEAFPKVPTLKEKGYDIVMAPWPCLTAPKGTPKPALDILEKAFMKAATDPAVQKKYKSFGFIPLTRGPQETRKQMDRYYELGKEMFTRAGLIK